MASGSSTHLHPSRCSTYIYIYIYIYMRFRILLDGVGCWVWRVACTAWGLEFRVKVKGSGFRVWSSEFMYGVACSVQGFGFWI